MRWKVLLLTPLLVLVVGCPPQVPQAPTSELVRFTGDAGAGKARARVLDAIWPDGVPATVPRVEVVAWPRDLQAVDRARVAKLERATIDVRGFESTAYILTPHDATGKVAIVHGGHQADDPALHLDAGLDDLTNGLLENGVKVALMQMPLSSWNRDRTGMGVTIGQSQVPGHNELFTKVDGMAAMSVFLEPVVQMLNLLGPATMTGLSGGGWTTTLVAALDERVTASIPVAGSLPLYVRPLSPGSQGDAEQVYAAVLGEDETGRPTGLMSYLEAYAMATTRGRVQVQVLNQRDTCCFGGDAYQQYGDWLHEMFPRWTVVSDQTATGHVVSAETAARIQAIAR